MVTVLHTASSSSKVVTSVSHGDRNVLIPHQTSVCSRRQTTQPAAALYVDIARTASLECRSCEITIVTLFDIDIVDGA